LACQAFKFDLEPADALKSIVPMQIKNEQVGFRISADLKRDLQGVAARERRTLSQLCEILLIGGLEGYKKEGSKYLQRMLSRYKKADGE
jgi:hypothetical protein